MHHIACMDNMKKAFSIYPNKSYAFDLPSEGSGFEIREGHQLSKSRFHLWFSSVPPGKC
jgi:hypothetical protein